MKTPQIHTATAASIGSLTIRALLKDEVIIINMGEEVFTYSESLRSAYFMSEMDEGEYVLVQCFKNVKDAAHAKLVAKNSGLL